MNTLQPIRRQLQLPVGYVLVQIPRMIARLGYFCLPIYLASHGTITKVVGHTSSTVPEYPHYWPIWLALVLVGISAIYKLYDPENQEVAIRRVLDRATAGASKQLQEFVLNCQGSSSLEAIQSGILSMIVDEVEQYCHEQAHAGNISSNFMAANDASELLKLKVFARQHVDRYKVDVPYSNPGAGMAIRERRIIYVRNIMTDDLKSFFRSDARYRSILSMPVFCAHCAIGVVNVDSVKPDAFHRETELADLLRPHVEMIGLSECL